MYVTTYIYTYICIHMYVYSMIIHICTHISMLFFNLLQEALLLLSVTDQNFEEQWIKTTKVCTYIGICSYTLLTYEYIIL